VTKVEVDGAQEAARRVKGLEDKVATKAAHKRVADAVFRRADPKTPEASGALRRTGRTSGTKAGAVLRWGGARAPYARNHEFGDLSRPQGGFVIANPWAFKSAEDAGGQRVIIEAFEDEADKLPRVI